MRASGPFVAAATIALSLTAAAVPPDARLVLAPGAEKFLKTRFRVDTVLVEPEGLVHAEGLPANEVYVTVPPGAKGAGLVLAIGLDRVFAWDLCVGDPRDCPSETVITTARAACPGLAQITDDGKQLWTATVKDVACLNALRDALAHAGFPGDRLRLVLEETAARAFYQRVGDGIAKDPACKGLVSGYYGATLKLSGRAPRRAVDRAVLHAYAETVGRVSFDAALVTLTDAPAPAPPPGPPPAHLIPLTQSLAASSLAPDAGSESTP